MRTIIITAQALATALLFGLPAGTFAAAADNDYVIRVDRNLARMTVAARFARPVSSLSARSRSAPDFLIEARDCDTDERLQPRGRRLVLPRGGLSCLHYEVDLAAAARSERVSTILDPGNIVASPTLWLWRPRLRDDTVIAIDFELPEDMSVFVPWQRDAGDRHRYLLRSSPQSGSATAIFGRFPTATSKVSGATLEIAFLDTGVPLDTAAIADWVAATAGNIALSYGRFPNPRTSVVIVPVGGDPWGGDSPVPFGRVVRDGGETVELLVNERRPVAEYYAEWTPTHEFSHLMLPYLRREHRWISEGFASYYQNVLLVRTGQYSEAEGWQRLGAGFERGGDSVPDLSPNAAATGPERNTRMKIYWSGAALALLADVELRERSGGRESLDSVLDQLQRCCLPSRQTWSGPALFARLDSFLDDPVFMPLYRRYANSAGFPEVGTLLHRLGVSAAGESVQLADDAELAEIRRAIMAPVRP